MEKSTLIMEVIFVGIVHWGIAQTARLCSLQGGIWRWRSLRKKNLVPQLTTKKKMLAVWLVTSFWQILSVLLRFYCFWWRSQNICLNRRVKSQVLWVIVQSRRPFGTCFFGWFLFAFVWDYPRESYHRCGEITMSCVDNVPSGFPHGFSTSSVSFLKVI